MSTTTAAPKHKAVASKEAWVKNKTHLVTLPSGTVVEITLPNMPALMRSGKIPNELMNAAVGADEDTQITPELLKEQAEFYNFLVAATVSAPAITEADVEDLPYEDVEMLVAFALRQRDVDAVYHHIGGLEKVKSFRDFRKLANGDSGTSDV